MVKLPDSPGARLALRIVRLLRAHGHKAYLVGGCVRDLLLQEPDQATDVKDWDVATSASPEQVAALIPGAKLVGASFGVVLVREGEVEVEVATFRSEHSYLDGRHPSVVKFEAEPEQDVRRRDFTVNALLLDPDTGELLDFVGGRDDLARGVIRAIGDPVARFNEDYLRMLRAVRFAATLKTRTGDYFEIEPETLSAIQRLACLVRRVSAERIRDELTRILTEGNARRGFELLDRTGLLEVVLPQVAAMKGVEQPPEFHPEGDVWTHTLIMLELLGKPLEVLQRPTVTLAWGVLLHDVGKPATQRFADRIRFDDHCRLGAEIAGQLMRWLRFSNAEVERVQWLVANHLRFKDVQRMRESTLRRFLRSEGFEELLELHRLDCLASHGDLQTYHFTKTRWQELLQQPQRLRPPRLVTGNDLIALGYRPGPAFRAILEAVETAQLEDRIRSREEALAYVRSRFAPPDGQSMSADT